MARRPLVARARSSRVLRWPSSRYGRKAVGLFGVAAILVIGMISVVGIWYGVVEDAPGEQQSPPLWLQVPLTASSFVAGGSALTGGVLAFMAIRGGDRSALLFLPVAAALIAFTFLIGEAVVPH